MNDNSNNREAAIKKITEMPVKQVVKLLDFMDGMENENTTESLMELGQYIAETEKRNLDFLSGLKPQKTALFFGSTHDKIWKVQRRQTERRSIRKNLHRLLGSGYDTILVEGSTLFGYYALDELARQKQKYDFTLAWVNKLPCNDWTHAQNRRLQKARFWRSIRMTHSVDYYIDEVTRHNWFLLINKKISLILTENSKIIRNKFLLTQDQYCQWGPPPTCTSEEYFTSFLQESEDA